MPVVNVQRRRSGGVAALEGASAVLSQGLSQYREMKNREARDAANRAYSQSVHDRNRREMLDDERRRHEQAANDSIDSQNAKDELSTVHHQRAMEDFEFRNPDLIEHAKDAGRPLTPTEMNAIRKDRMARTADADKQTAQRELAGKYGGDDAEFYSDFTNATGHLPGNFAQNMTHRDTPGGTSRAGVNDPEVKRLMQRKQLTDAWIKRNTQEEAQAGAEVVDGKQMFVERKVRKAVNPQKQAEVDKAQAEMDDYDKKIRARFDALDSGAAPATSGAGMGQPRAAGPSQAAKGSNGQQIDPRNMAWTVQDEKDFRAWYGHWAKHIDVPADPDAPGQHFDYRAAFAANRTPQHTQINDGPLAQGVSHDELRFEGDTQNPNYGANAGVDSTDQSMLRVPGQAPKPQLPSQQTQEAPQPPAPQQRPQPQVQAPPSIADAREQFRQQQTQPRQQAPAPQAQAPAASPTRTVKMQDVAHLPKIASDQEYDALPQGASFLDTDDNGATVVRVKP